MINKSLKVNINRSYIDHKALIKSFNSSSDSNLSQVLDSRFKNLRNKQGISTHTPKEEKQNQSLGNSNKLLKFTKNNLMKRTTLGHNKSKSSSHASLDWP